MKSLPALAALLALLVLPNPAVTGQEEGARHSLSADALAGFGLASSSLDPASADSAALWILQGNFLQRLEAPGWGLVLSYGIDLAGQGGAATSPLMTIWEAYARLELGDSGQLFLGKRRLGMGLGTTFAPGDTINPRNGFWDQKTGFRGIALALGFGSELSLRAAASFDPLFDAYAAGLRAKAAVGGPTEVATRDAYLDLLDGAAGPADPRLLALALTAELQLGSLQAAAAMAFRAGAVARPSLGLSLDLGGLILQAEGAVELAGSPDWQGCAGARYAWIDGPASLSLSLDYDYAAGEGLLEGGHYLLPAIQLGREEAYSLTLRSLVALAGPSALLSGILAVYPVPGFDLELTGQLALGATGEEFASLAAPPSPLPGGSLDTAIGLAARVHF